MKWDQVQIKMLVSEQFSQNRLAKSQRFYSKASVLKNQ